MEEICRITENKILIVIAHRMSTIEKCQPIYSIAAIKIHVSHLTKFLKIIYA
jgi:ABC-type bacteriocin/lantibiotic exporter with double-glycine peptidase domain